MAKVRKPSHQLLVTYVRPKEGKYFSRSVDKQRKVERSCARPEISEAAKCAREKLKLKKQ